MLTKLCADKRVENFFGAQILQRVVMAREIRKEGQPEVVVSESVKKKNLMQSKRRT